MLSTTSLPLLPGPLWSAVVVPDRVSTIDQIKLFDHLTVWKLMIDVELLLLHSNIWNNLTVQTNELCWIELLVLKCYFWSHLSECKNWIIGITLQYLEPVNYVQIKLLVLAILQATSQYETKW